jgi:hypothetical protein
MDLDEAWPGKKPARGEKELDFLKYILLVSCFAAKPSLNTQRRTFFGGTPARKIR